MRPHSILTPTRRRATWSIPSGSTHPLLSRRLGLGHGLLFFLVLALSSCQYDGFGVVLKLQAPAGVTLGEYAVTIQDHDRREIIYRSGSQPIAAVSRGRDLFAEPLLVGIRLSKQATYLIHVRGAVDRLVPDGVLPSTRQTEYFFADLLTVVGTEQIEAPLLAVEPNFDQDFDHFPDVAAWRAAVQEAATQYQAKPEVLDCVDHDPGATEMKLPLGLYAVDINPLAKPRCGLPFDNSCGDEVAQCNDKDEDGDPEGTDCDDSDPARFHGNPRPRNCCECTDRASCGINHSKLRDLSVCMPARCDSSTDVDCSGQIVPCFVDSDCDGYSPNDPVASQRDCDDTNPNIYPGAKKDCTDTTKDWACDGNPAGGCVDCDVDGDGFQRSDKSQGGSCPTAAYVTSGKSLDCDDNDRGVFPGSTSYNGVSQLIGFMDLKAVEGGGSKVAALRRLCANTLVDGVSAQDSDCDGNARNGCPANPGTCDQDQDGFPNATAGCNPNSLPIDNNDIDYQSFLGAPDRCGDGKAQNGVSDSPCNNDADGDGYNGDVDCDNNDKNTHPWAPELCDGKDNDCDGIIDELNPDDKGARMVEMTTVAPIKKVILSCTDFALGECNRNDAATGLKTGRCVCSGLKPGAHDPNGVRKSCPATLDTTATAPKCFGAQQKSKQTCEAVVANRKDQDCDGRLDAPDGTNLTEYGEVCGVDTGECVAGTVRGCDFTKSNPFSIASGFAIQPRFDEARKYLTCSGFVGPSNQLCDGKDQNCNGISVAACVAPNPICSTTAEACVQCLSSFDCAGTPGTPVCRSDINKCVQCVSGPDCAGVVGKPTCRIDQNVCVECIVTMDCAPPKTCQMNTCK